jgi:hypothetical protein
VLRIAIKSLRILILAIKVVTASVKTVHGAPPGFLPDARCHIGVVPGVPGLSPRPPPRTCICCPTKHYDRGQQVRDHVAGRRCSNVMFKEHVQCQVTTPAATPSKSPCGCCGCTLPMPWGGW